VADADGGCVYTNEVYQRILGLTFKQALGTWWSVAIHPEDRDRVLADWDAAARGEAPFRPEFRFQRRDGSIVWTRVNSAAMCDGRGSAGHVQTVENITARKLTEFGLRAAEQALFEEKERAQVTLNSIGDAVVSTDLLGKVTFMNKAAETMTGWSCQEALGRPLAEVFRIIDGTTRVAAVDPARVVEKLRAALAVPYLIGGHNLRVTLSMGISVFPDDGFDSDTLMQKADTAMYHAKASGRDNYLFVRPARNTDADRRSSV